MRTRKIFRKKKKKPKNHLLITIIATNSENNKTKKNTTGDRNDTKKVSTAVVATLPRAAVVADSEDKEGRVHPSIAAAQFYQHLLSTATSTRIPSVYDIIVKDS